MEAVTLTRREFFVIAADLTKALFAKDLRDFNPSLRKGARLRGICSGWDK